MATVVVVTASVAEKCFRGGPGRPDVVRQVDASRECPIVVNSVAIDAHGVNTFSNPAEVTDGRLRGFPVRPKNIKIPSIRPLLEPL